MMTTDTVDSGSPPTRKRRPASWGVIAVSLAHEMANENFLRRDLAELRRMDPNAPDAAVVWRLLAQHELLGSQKIEDKWALILHGIAVMTPTGSGDGRTAHDFEMPVGRALYCGGDSQRTAAYYSESRLNRLLTARGPILRSLLARLFRMLAAAGQPFNWREMASFILNDGYNEEAAERARRRIAREYFRTERQNTPSE